MNYNGEKNNQRMNARSSQVRSKATAGYGDGQPGRIVNNTKNQKTRRPSLFEKLLLAIARGIGAFFDIKISLKWVFLALIIIAGSAVGYTYRTIVNNVGGTEDYEEALQYIEIKDLVEKNFIDSADREAMGNAAANAIVSSLGDKWSYYMSADEYRTYKLSGANEYTGIGMAIQKDKATGGFQIISISNESPAYKAGLSTGMIITAIDGQKVTSMDEDEVRTLIRSLMNTSFVVATSNSKETLTVDCSATHVSGVKSRLEKTEAGYVQLLNFEAGTGGEAIAAIEDLLTQGASSLVIDLRNNAGGLVGEAQILLDYLLPQGTLFTSRDKGGKTTTYESDSMCIQMPMCVLINTQTFDAAEIFAAVLQEYQWATIIGEPSNGSTREQSTIELENGSAIRLSTHAYYTANGVDIAAKGGVVPDMILYNTDESTAGTTEGTTGTNADGTAFASNDEQLMAALKLLS